jgi:hypothetical protein
MDKSSRISSDLEYWEPIGKFYNYHWITMYDNHNERFILESKDASLSANTNTIRHASTSPLADAHGWEYLECKSIDKKPIAEVKASIFSGKRKSRRRSIPSTKYSTPKLSEKIGKKKYVSSSNTQTENGMQILLHVTIVLNLCDCNSQ